MPANVTAIAARAAEALRHGEVRLGWDSEQLGRVDIKATVHGQEVAAAVKVESDAARQWMTSDAWSSTGLPPDLAAQKERDRASFLDEIQRFAKPRRLHRRPAIRYRLIVDRLRVAHRAVGFLGDEQKRIVINSDAIGF